MPRTSVRTSAGVHFEIPRTRGITPVIHEPHQRLRRPHVEIFVEDDSHALVRLEKPPKAPDFLFCVEMGMLVRSRTVKHKNARTLLDEVSIHLRHAGVANHVHSRRLGTPESYKDWTVIEDL